MSPAYRLTTLWQLLECYCISLSPAAAGTSSHSAEPKYRRRPVAPGRTPPGRSLPVRTSILEISPKHPQPDIWNKEKSQNLKKKIITFLGFGKWSNITMKAAFKFQEHNLHLWLVQQVSNHVLAPINRWQNIAKRLFWTNFA